MKTVIFLSQKRYDMYHFDRFYDANKYRFVAILEPDTYQHFPPACKQYFSKLYQVELQNKATAIEDFTLDYEATCDIVAHEIAQAGSAEQVVIIAIDESNVILAALLRDKYYIPGPSYAEMTLYKNKLKMKTQLQKHKVRIPKFIPLDTELAQQQPEKFHQEICQTISAKFVIKPVSGASSLDTVIISSLADFLNWANQHKNHSKRFELEEFIEGQMYECDSLVKDGEVVFFAVSEYTCPNLDFFDGKVLGSIPLEASNPLVPRLAEFSQSALSVLGMLDGGMHMEVFVTPEDEIVFLEVGARPPGGFVITNYEKNYGFNLLDEELSIKLNRPLSIPTMAPQKHLFWGMIAIPQGKVVRVCEPKLKSKAEFNWTIKPGDYFKGKAKNFSELALVFYVENDNYQVLYSDFELARDFSFIETE